MQTELSWLLDDAVAGMVTAAGDSRQVNWRWIERGLRSNELAEQQLQQEVQLRAPLQALGERGKTVRFVERGKAVRFVKRGLANRSWLLGISDALQRGPAAVQQLAEHICCRIAPGAALGQERVDCQKQTVRG
mgnify:CR=1 FL=1